MTTYRFSRNVSKSNIASSFITLEYFKFFAFTCLFFFLDLINIPIIFEGEYHLFLFESFLFLYIFFFKKPIYFITIFVFYGLIDIIQLNYVSTSFLAFFTSVLILFVFLKRSPSNMFFITVLLPISLALFCLIKLSLINLFIGFSFSFSIFVFYLKSIIYTSLILINFYLIFYSKKNF